MKRNLSANEICRIIEKEVSGTRCTVSPTSDQIVVQFEKRPEIIIHLLSPFYQILIKKGGIPEEEISLLVSDVRKIAERRVYSDTIIEDVSSFIKKEDNPQSPE